MEALAGRNPAPCLFDWRRLRPIPSCGRAEQQARKDPKRDDSPQNKEEIGHDVAELRDSHTRGCPTIQRLREQRSFSLGQNTTPGKEKSLLKYQQESFLKRAVVLHELCHKEQRCLLTFAPTERSIQSSPRAE
jgi:hypothetical protein